MSFLLKAQNTWENFAKYKINDYSKLRNFDFGPNNESSVSKLSPFITHRILSEYDLIHDIKSKYKIKNSTKFVEEIFWRVYWKGWMENRPKVWLNFISEKISLREKREDYSGLQERIDKLKQKYQLIRDQKIRERVEALGVNVQEGDDRETLLEKEKNYTLERQKIENALESFYRSANSLVFQLNKRHITRNMSIFRCIDRRFENGEVYIKWDEVPDDEWLILIYIKDNSPNKGIVIEDKSNPEKNVSNEFKPSEIFKASDMMVDSLTQLLERERSKKDN